MFIDKQNTGLGAVGNLFLILLITSHMVGMNLLPPALSCFSYVKQEHSGDHSETFTILSYFKFYAFFKFQSVLKLQDSLTLWEMQVFTVRNNLGSQIWLVWKGLILAMFSMWPMTTKKDHVGWVHPAITHGTGTKSPQLYIHCTLAQSTLQKAWSMRQNNPEDKM